MQCYIQDEDAIVCYHMLCWLNCILNIRIKICPKDPCEWIRRGIAKYSNNRYHEVGTDSALYSSPELQEFIHTIAFKSSCMLVPPWLLYSMFCSSRTIIFTNIFKSIWILLLNSSECGIKRDYGKNIISYSVIVCSSSIFIFGTTY